MPVRTGYKIGVSLNPDAKTISNVRNALFVDYVDPQRTWSLNAGSTTSDTTDNLTWGLALPNCAQLGVNTQLNTSLLFANNNAFTIMMRVRFKSLLSSAGFVVLFNNGDANLNNTAFVYYFDGNDHMLQFSDFYNGGGNFTNATQANTWYHLAVTGGHSVNSYEMYLNGTSVFTIGPLTSQTYSTFSCFGYSLTNNVPFQFTDFVVLNKVISPDQIRCYADAAFI